jgi:hypothetical protein
MPTLDKLWPHASSQTGWRFALHAHNEKGIGLMNAVVLYAGTIHDSDSHAISCPHRKDSMLREHGRMTESVANDDGEPHAEYRVQAQTTTVIYSKTPDVR